MPELNKESVDYAAVIYSSMRNKALNYDQSKISVPITVRTLETLIRLATAHAKMRISKQVDINDIEIAAKLLNNTIFQENDGLLDDIKEEDEDDEVQVD